MDEKIYIGTSKARKNKYGTTIGVSFSRKDLETLEANMNEKGYVNLNINPRKNPGKYGETHSVTINTWKPAETSSTAQEEIDINSIPF